MHRFKNILVVYDRFRGSRDALDHAVSLAADNQARLTVALCLSKFDDSAPAALVDSIVRGLEAYIQSLLEPCAAKDVPSRIRTLRARPFIQIIRAVLIEGYDLVIKSAAPVAFPAGDARPFASTELHLLRKCPCPVWVIREGAPRPAKRVVAAIGPGFATEGGDATDLRIMELATSLAKRHGAETLCVHIFEEPDDNLVRFLGIDDRQELDTLCRREARAVGKRFRAFVDRFKADAPSLKIHTGIGNAAQAIETAAGTCPANIIVMSTVRIAATPGFLFGSTAEAVLQRCATGVLAIKPPGFESPVAPA